LYGSFLDFKGGKEKMERSSNYRLLKIREILFQQTDDQNEMGISELVDKLRELMPERQLDHRTIKKDLETLDDMDFEVVTNKGKFGKNYYSHQTRLFETYQLRLMVDAILSAKFITTKEKKLLIEKLKQLTSKQIAKTLPEPVLFSQSANIDYELVKLNIDFVHRAIAEKKILTYQYGKFNVDKKFEYNRNGDLYYVEPYALIWQNDYYYLIGRFIKTDEVRHYRLDRMRNIHLTNERFIKKDFDLNEYVNQSFHMFAGEEIRIKIRFHLHLVNVVLDRFGHDANIKQLDDKHFLLTTKAKLSDGLINWILTWGHKAKVIEPEYVVQEMRERIQQMAALYMTDND
jgi:predicted DNA-binding transcriptional regulator YafY